MSVQCLEKFHRLSFILIYLMLDEIFRDILHRPPFFCFVFLGEQKNEGGRQVTACRQRQIGKLQFLKNFLVIF